MRHQAWHRRGLLVIFAVFAFLIVSGTVLSSFQWIHKPFPGFFLHENLTVGPYSLPHWSGNVAGLQSLDLVIKIDDSAVGGARRALRARAQPSGRHPLDLYNRSAFTHPRINHSQHDVYLAGLVLKFWRLRFHRIGILGNRCGALLFSSKLPSSFAAIVHGDSRVRLV